MQAQGTRLRTVFSFLACLFCCVAIVPSSSEQNRPRGREETLAERKRLYDKTAAAADRIAEMLDDLVRCESLPDHIPASPSGTHCRKDHPNDGVSLGMQVSIAALTY